LNKSKTLVFIPAYNEENSIGHLLDSLLDLKVQEIDILVIDDGSSDKTNSIVEDKDVKLISHEGNKGYESALSTGFNYACQENYCYAVSFDADGQIDPKDIIKFLSHAVENEADLVVGIRDYRNRFSEKLLATYGKYKYNIQDPLCGIKLYRISACKHLLPFDTCNLVGMEMAFKMIEDGKRVFEQNINITKRNDNSRYGSSFKGEFNIISSLIRSISLFGIRKIS